MSSAALSELNYMILIPAYNEEATIEALIEDVLKQKPEQLLIVNDASCDKTADISVSHK